MGDPARRIRRELIRRELARRDYGSYLSLVYGDAWIPTRFASVLAREVQSFLETDTGNAYDILILEAPPQHGKSWALTEALPSWYLGRWPDRRTILISYNDESAERFARRNREKLRLWGPVLFDVSLGGMDRGREFELSGRRGRLISRGVLSGVTGHPADLLLIDDPIKSREEADSPAYRQKLWAEWVNSFKSRLSAHAKAILVMTPWHEDDLAARILRTEDHVRLLRFPVEAEDRDPLGRAPGDPLCPELGRDAHWLEQFRSGYLRDPHGGQRAWLALYLCRPRTEEGGIVRRGWWRYHDAPPDCPVQVISVDAAFKGEERNDFVCVTVWGKSGEMYYLLSCRNEHLGFSGTLDAIRQARRTFPRARAVLIEDKANGPAVIEVLQREMFCIPVDPKGGKTARVHAVSPAIESGHVSLPRSAPWIEEYLDQWSAFPHGPHDDMIDSSTQALSWLFRVEASPPPSPTDGASLFTDGSVYDVYGQALLPGSV